ncbi:MAG: 3-methyl-2-oxobutanoate hydroxymethyltransferase [Phycisphaerae bacterium]|nr:3-methyl-2-oxobutanoate hydroxymethyltransferase [Phycisphaerae bacterium]
MTRRITISDLIEAKRQARKIAAVSCYDYTTARRVAQAGVQMILVGDSAAQVMLGHDSTLPATMDYMVTITAAVRRAAPQLFLVADMPFLSYNVGVYEAVKNAGRFVQEAGAQMIKIECTAAQLDVIKAVSDADMGVMAHIGIRPQSLDKVGKLRAEGTTAQVGLELIVFTERLVEAGARCLLLEGVAREVAAIITRRTEVPVISCGSGCDCDGQILIISDILGLSPDSLPKFSKRYAELGQAIEDAVGRYATEVAAETFPDDEHSYHLKPGQLEKLDEMLGDMGR